MQFQRVYNWAANTVLDVPNGDPGTERVQQFTFNGGHNQQWGVVPVPDSPFVQLVCRATGRALSVPDFFPATYAGQQVLLKQEPFAAATLGQSWALFQEGGVTVIDSALAPLATHVLTDNGPVVVDHPANEMVLDVPFGIGQDGGDVQLYPINDGTNQHWALPIVEDVDAYLIISVHSQLVLDVPGFSGVDTPIQQYAYNGGPNQLWQLFNANGQPYVPFLDAGQGPGPFSIVSVASGKALHIDDQGLLGQTEPTGGADQQWLALIRQFSTGFGSEQAWVLQNQNTGQLLSEFSADFGGSIGQQPDAGDNRAQAWWFARSGTQLFQPGVWPPA